MGLQAMSVGFWVVVGLMVLAVALLGSFMARLYRKAGPHQALIVYGFRGTRIVRNHGTVIFPMVETFRELSLELMSFDVAPQQDLYPNQGVAASVEAVAQTKGKSDPDSTGAEAEPDPARRRAIATREAAVAKAQADQERVLAETQSLAKQAESQRDLEVKKAEYQELIKRQQAQADKSYEIQANVMQ